MTEILQYIVGGIGFLALFAYWWAVTGFKGD